jgi:hypothetical protein
MPMACSRRPRPPGLRDETEVTDVDQSVRLLSLSNHIPDSSVCSSPAMSSKEQDIYSQALKTGSNEARMMFLFCSSHELTFRSQHASSLFQETSISNIPIRLRATYLLCPTSTTMVK